MGLYQTLRLRVFTALLMLCSGWLQAQPTPVNELELGNQATPDVRVIIDISGSMKQNDPLNLRRPALELLVQLFPEQSKAGVWTFGQWVNNLVPSEPVTDRWRQTARAQAQKINSVALHTNIPEALQRAMADEDLNADYQTHFILLTDGMVDVSKDPAQNEAARQSVLNELLPQLRDAGIRVHTVALSNNADSELMERLALGTDGLAAVAESAEDLTRIFLQAFDAAAPAEEVPLEDNRFLVDSSIEEFTALVFRKDGSQPTVLVSPDNKTYSKNDHGSDVRWFSQQNYDLITVQQPYEGEWMIQADLEPSSRVTIVSNLSLQVNRLPKGYFIGNDLHLSAALQEQGAVIKRPEFLDLVDVRYEIVRRSDGERWIKNLSDLDPHPVDGVFSDRLSALELPDVYDITVTANAKTFQRQQKQTVEARRNFLINTRASDDIPATHTLSVTTKNPAINTDTLKITATVSSPLGDDTTQMLTAISERSWQMQMTGAEQSVNYRVNLDIVGLYADGSPLRASESLLIEHIVPGTAMAMPEPEPTPEPEPEPEATPEPEAPAEQVTEEPAAEDEGIDWAKMGLYAGLALGNLLVIVLGYFAYKTVKGGGSSDILEEEDELAPADLPSETEAMAAAADDEPETAEAPPEPEPATADSPAAETAAEEDLDLSSEDDVAEVDVDAADADVDIDENSADDLADDLGDALDLPDDAIDIDPEKP